MIDLRAYKAKHGCFECLEKDPDLLCFHHVNPESKLYDISKMRSYSDALILDELRKCIVLCTTHHIKYHAEYRFQSKLQLHNLDYNIED